MNKPVLPESFTRPAALWWVFILPQTLLFLINMHACWLVGPGSRWSWLAVLTYEAVLIGLAATLWWFGVSRGKAVSVKVSSLLLGANIMHLFVMVNAAQNLVPDTIDLWILDTGDLMLSQFTFMMPGIFYGVTRLSCHKLEVTVDQNKAALWFLGAIFVLPVLLLGSFLLFGHAYNLFTFVPFFVFTAVVLFFMHLFIRFVLATYHTLAEKGALENSILRILMAASGPALISLLAKVFDVWTGPEQITLFILVSINAVLMILPSWWRSPGWLGAGLFLRSVTYPVTFYFFLMVLPYLPLAVFLILALGIGFLGWIPVALFLLHTKSLVEDWKAAVAGLGRWKAAAWLSAGIMVLPAYFCLGAVSDRIVLNKALEYVYSSDARGEVHFNGSARDVARTMRALKDFKDGDGFPYLSDMYNAIVFQGLVLSDKKIQYVYKLFSGEDLSRFSDGWGGGYWGRGSRSSRSFRGWRAPVDHNVDLVSATAKPVKLPGHTQSTLSLGMAWAPEPDKKDEKNSWRGTTWQREFVQPIDLPPGVLITGFRLKVGNDFVPGKIFEKKTALWVYEQIRDTRRDPGLLVYQSPTRVELKVFPVMQKETRQVEIDFLFPDTFAPVLKLGGRSVALAGDSARPVPAAVVSPRSVVLAEGAIQQLPRTVRKPYLHFIIDRSLHSVVHPSVYPSMVKSAMEQYPGVSRARLTAANFEMQALSPGMIDLRDPGQLTAALNRMALPLQGSLDLQRVLQNAILEYKEQCLDQAGSSCWQEYPVFVVLTGAAQRIMPFPDGIDTLARYMPESTSYWVVSAHAAKERKLLWSASVFTDNPEVVVFKQGPRVSVVSAQAGGFYDRAENAPLEVFETSIGNFRLLDNVRPAGENLIYEEGLDLLRRNENALTSLKDMDREKRALVSRSKELEVLIPASAYIVVERDAQWRGLEDREKQKLRASEAFDFDDPAETMESPQGMDSPSPSTWLLAGVVVAWYYWRRRRALRLSAARMDN